MSFTTLQRTKGTPIDVSGFQWAGFSILNQSVASTGSMKFSGRLEIPGAPFETPEQDFTATRTEDGFILENDPKDSWPKIKIAAVVDPPSGRPRTKYVHVYPSVKTVAGELLYTRVMFSIAKARRCALVSANMRKVAELKFHPLPLEEQGFFYHAKLVRKLKYLEDVFGVRFTLPDESPGHEIFMIELVFRGITEGEVTIRDEDFTSIVSPSKVDPTKPPYASPGLFAQYQYIEDKVVLFGQSLPVGPVHVFLEKAEIANPRVLDRIREGQDQPIEVRFQVLDHRITFIFEEFAKRPREPLTQRLEEFKQELAREEPQELANLVSEPLQGKVTSDEAVKIAVGWLCYNRLPDRFCPQEPELDETAGCWRVPIHLVYTSGAGGSVGEIVVDLESGVIIRHTAVDDLRSRGLALAEKILHAR